MQNVVLLQGKVVTLAPDTLTRGSAPGAPMGHNLRHQNIHPNTSLSP